MTRSIRQDDFGAEVAISTVRASWFRRRLGSTSPAVIMLLAGILVALVVLILVLMTQKKAPGPVPGGIDRGTHDTGKGPPVRAGQTITRGELNTPPQSPRPVGDSGRIREMLLVGKTYRVVLKAGFDARVEDKAWGLKQVVNLAYATEMAIDRTIESNDGKQIVELRHFVTSRNVKLLYDVESVTVDLGLPGVLVLGALESILPGTTEVVLSVKPIAESLLGYGAHAVGQSKATKAVAHVDTLSGKKVRITYVDGVGVESTQPEGCELTTEERDFVFATATLSDCYLLPDIKCRPGTSWTVDGAQLVGFLDPSLRGAPSGEITIARDDDVQENGKQYATLQIKGGFVEVNASDDTTHRIGTFEPRGSLRYSISDGFVDRAKLTGRLVFEEVSRNHILFETSFRSRPTIKIEYTCAIR
ncbi:MAG TPA: hypothetical protein VGZ22_28555 [Isosphaeraceae bacterium]|jgi:hypothetical protein|nr:hypothetical protein [Isosphaeraceae bacterium]